MADLTPAPYPFDSVTMMINDTLKMQVADHIRAHPDEYECLIGTSLDDVEARAFVQTHTGALAVERSFAVGAPPVAQTVHSLLSRYAWI